MEPHTAMLIWLVAETPMWTKTCNMMASTNSGTSSTSDIARFFQEASSSSNSLIDSLHWTSPISTTSGLNASISFSSMPDIPTIKVRSLKSMSTSDLAPLRCQTTTTQIRMSSITAKDKFRLLYQETQLMPLLPKLQRPSILKKISSYQHLMRELPLWSRMFLKTKCLLTSKNTDTDFGLDSSQPTQQDSGAERMLQITSYQD